MLMRRGAISIAAARVNASSAPLAAAAADPLRIGSRERIPLVKVKDPRSENMINACTHEVYLGKRLVLSVIVEIG